MAMHPAVAALLAQPVTVVSVSTLSSVLDALRERDVRVALTCSSGGASSCKELLQRLVAVANDGTCGTAARVLCIECMYTLSCDASEAFCQGDLFAAVQQLNASVDALFAGGGVSARRDVAHRVATSGGGGGSSSSMNGGVGVCRCHRCTRSGAGGNAGGCHDDDDDDDGGDDVLAASRAMLTALLFRCTAYTRLRAGDVLHQLCGGDERRLVRLLRTLLLPPPSPQLQERHDTQQHHNTLASGAPAPTTTTAAAAAAAATFAPSVTTTTAAAAAPVEWPLRVALVRCMYELTTPASYFSADEDVSDVRADAFLSRMASLRACMLQRTRTLLDVLDDASVQWRRAMTGDAGGSAAGGGVAVGRGGSGLGALGDPAALASLGCPSAAQVHALTQWCVLLRYVAVMVQNMVDYSDCFAQVHAMQSLLHREALSFVTTVAVPFVMAALHTWEWSAAAESVGADNKRAGDANRGNTKAGDELMHTSLLVLRVVRLVLCPPRDARQSPSQHEPPQPPMHVQAVLSALTQQVTRLEPLLRDSHVGMLVMVVTAECLCNVDASHCNTAAQAVSPSSSPLSLAAAFDELLRRVASDMTPLRLHNGRTTADGFLLCFLRLETPFCACDNDTVTRVQAMLSRDKDTAAIDEEAMAMVAELEAQLLMLQEVMMQLTMCSVLSELRLGGYDAAMHSREGNALLLQQGNNDHYHYYHGNSSTQPEQQQQRTSASSGGGGASAAARQQHPSQYCCQLTGKLMREPVVLRNGHRYDYDALMRVIADVGHVDPQSGEVFDDDDVVVDVALQQEIARYRVRAAAGK